MTDSRTVRPGEAVTYHATERQPIALPDIVKLSNAQRQPIPILHSRSPSSQRLIRALDAILDLGHSEIDLRIGTRSELIAWAGLHGLTVETSEMGEHQLTRVLHKDRIQTLAMLMEVA